MSKPRDGVSVVIPAHDAAAALDQVLPAWGAVLGKLNRPFEILVVNDGSTDNTAEVLRKRASNVPNLRVLTHDAPQGFGACLRTALAEAKQPLLLHAGVDYPYTPGDIRVMLERIELRDEIFGKQPDLISGARSGQQPPLIVAALGYVWKYFWRVFAGLPVTDPLPWYGWDEWWYRVRSHWVFGVPLADVNSAFKLWRVAFLKRFPIQSDGDFVHVELVAKATFLTSIMDEVPLTPKDAPLPPLGPVAADRRKVFRNPIFAHEPQTSAAPPAPEAAPVPTTPPAPPAPELTKPVVPAPAVAPPNAEAPPGEKKSESPAEPPKPAEAKAPTPATSEPAKPAPAPTAAPQPNVEPPPPANKSEPAAAPTPSTPAQAAPAPATPASSEPPKPVEPPSASPEQKQPEAAKPAADSSKPTPPSQDKPAEPNAGGLSSPGSPVPAT